MFGRKLSLLDYIVVAVVGSIGGIYTTAPLLKELENHKKNLESSTKSSTDTSKES